MVKFDILVTVLTITFIAILLITILLIQQFNSQIITPSTTNNPLNACGANCPEGLVCDPLRNRCVLPIGAKCNSAFDCESNAYCSEVCTTGPFGQLNQNCPCDRGLVCISGKCKKDLNESCAINSDCASGSCINNKCNSAKQNGFACNLDSDCASGNCSNNYCQNPGVISGGSNAVCFNNNMCNSGRICSNNTCVMPTAGFTQSCAICAASYLCKDNACVFDGNNCDETTCIGGMVCGGGFGCLGLSGIGVARSESCLSLKSSGSSANYLMRSTSERFPLINALSITLFPYLILPDGVPKKILFINQQPAVLFDRSLFVNNRYLNDIVDITNESSMYTSSSFTTETYGILPTGELFRLASDLSKVILGYVRYENEIIFPVQIELRGSLLCYLADGSLYTALISNPLSVSLFSIQNNITQFSSYLINGSINFAIIASNNAMLIGNAYLESILIRTNASFISVSDSEIFVISSGLYFSLISNPTILYSLGSSTSALTRIYSRILLNPKSCL